jgi:hypothetical protein
MSQKQERVTASKVVNALFERSPRLNTTRGYSLLREEDRNVLKGFIKDARKGRPTGPPQERIDYYIDNIPADIVDAIDLATATRFANSNSRRKYVRSSFLATVPDAGLGRKATPGEIAGQAAVAEERKQRTAARDAEFEALGRATEARMAGADEASLTRSDTLAIAGTSADDPEDGGDGHLRNVDFARQKADEIETELVLAAARKAIEEAGAPPPGTLIKAGAKRNRWDEKPKGDDPKRFRIEGPAQRRRARNKSFH